MQESEFQSSLEAHQITQGAWCLAGPLHPTTVLVEGQRYSSGSALCRLKPQAGSTELSLLHAYRIAAWSVFSLLWKCLTMAVLNGTVRSWILVPLAIWEEWGGGLPWMATADGSDCFSAPLHYLVTSVFTREDCSDMDFSQPVLVSSCLLTTLGIWYHSVATSLSQGEL